MKQAKSITTINLGLNHDHYYPIEKSLAKKALGIPENKFIIGFSCLDFKERRKGAEILMNALKSFPPNEIALVVLGAGSWPKTDVETITLGSLGTPRLQSLFYSSLDVLAMPSQAETFGLVAMEAMSCETPVVAYAAGGLTDVVSDGETGLLEKEVGSLSGLTQMLQWMWKHPAERMTMGQAGRRRVVEHLSDTLMAQRYTDLYDRIIAS
jgi:glycosyltransferase involved in cell wall biosynthesis